jgi:hypothetical protein
MPHSDSTVCAPNVHSSDHYTCFEMEELVSIAKAYNTFIKKQNLCSGSACAIKRPIQGLSTLSRKQIWEEIYYRLLPLCKYEDCWIDLSVVKSIPDKSLRDKIRFFTFKPKLSGSRYGWLTTQDINQVLRQYAKAHRDRFYFLGTFPSDFYKLQIVSQDYMQKLVGARPIAGIVLNLDEHDKPGTHWVAIIIDNSAKQIEYFDSLGNPPTKTIALFLRKLKKHTKGRYSVLHNPFVHQTDSAECGVYAMYFIIQRVLGTSFHDFVSTRKTDESMNKMRNILFRALSRE